MGKIVVILAFLLCFQPIFGQAVEKTVQVKGTIVNSFSTQSYVFLFSNMGRKDSCKIGENGFFLFELTLKKYEKFFQIVWKKTGKGTSRFELFLDNNDTVEVYSDNNEVVIQYQPEKALYKNFLKTSFWKLLEYTHSKVSYSDLEANKATEMTIPVLDSIFKSDGAMGIIFFEKIVKGFFVDSLSFKYMPLIREWIEHVPLEEKENLPSYQNLSSFKWLGDTIHDFNYLVDTSTSFYKIKNLPNKPKVLIFGASWCAPCRKVNNELKSKLAYKQGGDYKVEIIDISLDRSFKNWKNMVVEDKLPWKQFFIIDEAERENLWEMYFIPEIPKIILLDEQNKIVAHKANIDNVLNIINKL